MMETIILVVNALVIGFAMGMAFSDWKPKRFFLDPLKMMSPNNVARPTPIALPEI
ncbi:MAG: hypothetical protein MI976_06370 [Pseudomonadales bacterium]|nr:hypothetical protein [Pseudomonadales bacterium]